MNRGQLATRGNRAAYVDMIGGASGNMLLGALIDAGADAAAIECALRTIPVEGWTFERTRVVKRGIAAAYIDFAIPGEDHRAHERDEHFQCRGLAEVLAIIEGSGLSERVRAQVRAIALRLGEAEAHVRGTTIDAMHFHEVGAVDAILDVAGVCVALEHLAVDEVWCSAYPIGRGSATLHHGRSANPSPATADLMRGAPTVDAGIEAETVTATAAAILATLVREPGVRPALRVGTIGYGAGRSDFPIPNVTRVFIGDLTEEALVW
jgi:pyridinium-3,5-bisthiocarboxylic acid mononucleotide nickel chelatase